MFDDWKMELYWRMPVYLQEAALSLYARRLDQLYYGDGYQEWRRQFEGWKVWSGADAEAWQNHQLEFMLELAGNRVPYYREAWRKLDWRSVHSAQDLRILPLLDKQSLRQNEQAFIVDGLKPESLWLEKSSGTTGTPVKTYWSRSTLPKWSALRDTMILNPVGVGNDQPRAMMGTRPIIKGHTNKPPYWRYNRTWKQLYLSAYHVSQVTARGYAEAIQGYGSQWITGIGSAIAALAEFALQSAVPSLPLKRAIVSGDMLVPAMRSSIETFFKCKCLDQYGQNEGVAVAMECLHGKMHIIPGAGIWEILREDGLPCAPGEVGEIVGTGLINDAMPLIRYRLGDYAAWAEEQSCSCGNQQRIITSLEGRVDDYLITSDGRKIGRLSSAFTRRTAIHSAQIVQDEPDHAYVLIRPAEGYSQADRVAIKESIIDRIGNIGLEIIETSQIPKTPQGKTPLVVRLADRPALKGIYREIIDRKRISATTP